MAEGIPVDRVPNEILAEIFDYACDTNLLQEYPWSKDSFLPPTQILHPLHCLPAMSISSVSTSWRSVALSSPTIWSRISLELSVESSQLPNVESLLSGFLLTVKLHLHRSDQCSLTLKLNLSGDAYTNILRRPLLAFDLVCDHSWNSFELIGAYDISSIPKPRFDPIRNCHSLKNLTFTIAYDIPEGLELFNQATGLCSLSLPMLSTIPTTFRNQISSLAVETVDGWIGDVFSHTSSPKELELRERPDHHCNTLTSCVPPRLCPSVSTLKLELHDCARTADEIALVDAVFSSFTFPSLSCLVIMTEASYRWPYRGAWPRATLESFLHRSSCRLTNFEVKGIPVTDVDLIAALDLMPSLVYLNVDDTPSNDDPMSPITPLFIRSLHGFLRTELNPSSSALVPKLRELRLTFNGLQFDDSAFIDMVSSRWFSDTQYASGVGLSCLRVVTLRFNVRAVDEVVYRPLDRLDKAGMMVVVLGKSD
ncbi:hypothetical protein BDP27DRAFT_1418417 [Rhodocollybia butyracea]|uniref:F-box domain-containing protein n=1 Tax=Rhodocollybia butyracea TaxID=206335 RepID=A0A9P5Q0X2_9AGAR|nr:hypothetical protein BDP27DRAFT_1418417 [Rhodocollybia butyracea]